MRCIIHGCEKINHKMERKLVKYSYNGAFICDDHGVTIAATREEMVIKWLDYVSSHELLTTCPLNVCFYYERHALYYNDWYTLKFTGFDSVEVWRQVRQWSHYDEIIYINCDSRKMMDRPISHWMKRSKLRKVALLLSLKCDVMSMVARRLITKS